MQFLKTTLLLNLLFSTQFIFGQNLPDLDGKWAFTGLRTTVFKIENNKLYVGMLEYTDTLNFAKFIEAAPVELMVFSEASVKSTNDSVFIAARFPKIDHELNLIYLANVPDIIWYTGDVFFDSTRNIKTNSNCNVSRPICLNRLYSRAQLSSITQLKDAASFSRDDAFEFLLRLNQKLKSSCNRCYAGFTDAYMNEVLIEMGYNPITKRTAASQSWYNTSGFTSYLKTKFQNDARIVKLADLVFDWYIQ